MASSVGMKTILVVDDESEMRSSISAILSNQLSVNVLEASTAESALALLKLFQMNSIITDVRMPHMDGLEFISRVRQMGIKTPVIFISGCADKDMAIKALKLGAFDFMEKPFEKTQLVVTVKKALGADVSKFSSVCEGLNLKNLQMRVLEMVTSGKSNKEIANHVNLSEQGVKYHVGNLLAKFKVASRSELKNKITDLMSTKVESESN